MADPARAAPAGPAATGARWAPSLERWRDWAVPASSLAAVRLVLEELIGRFAAPAALLDELTADRPSDAATASAGRRLAEATVTALLDGPALLNGPALDGGDGELAGRSGVDPVEVAHLLASVYEATLPRPQRRGGGVFYTPPSVARSLVALALEGLGVGGDGPTVLDPACGAGTFLVAAADRLHRGGGLDVAACLAAVRGRDVDGAAVEVARTALAWWCWQHGGGVVWPGPGLRVGDGLAPGDAGGPEAGGATAVVGNPPFLNQLQGRTARAEAARALAQQRFGPAAKGYVDTAVLFLLAALDAVAEGGRVVLVQPESTVVASHAAAARAEVARRAALEAMWFGGPGIFAAGVRVCAPVLRRGAAGTADSGLVPREVEVFEGAAVTPARRFAVDSPQRREQLAAGDWAPLLAAARGVPSVVLRSGGTLEELATATAGFRDQFYGLVPYVVEAHAADTEAPATVADPARRAAPLVTSGLIELDGHAWGRRAARFARRRWSSPVVDLDALAAGDARLSAWVGRRLRPKLLVATQTRVLHAAADPAGALVPSVPVIAVEPHDPEDLWLVAAVLWCPAVSVLAAQRYAGAGLSAGALRLSARQILSLPTPVDARRWREAAALLRDGDRTATRCETDGDRQVERRLGDVARLMVEAYRMTPEAADQAKRWWQGVADRHRAATVL